MPIIVDTPVWSAAFRRHRRSLRTPQKTAVAEMRELIADGRVVLLGMIRQEILSGVRSASEFDQLSGYLAHFENEELDAGVYVQAAECHNTCRNFGIQGSAVDFLICGTSIARGYPIFTFDRDFVRYAKHIPIRLHEP
jgi:predicted nucleic acid-binding protein